MAEFIKVELVGTVSQVPFYTIGQKKDGTDYQLGSVNIKADNQFIKCVGWGAIADFIQILNVGDPVYIVGHQKNKKSKDEKWYAQIDISFIASMDVPVKPFAKQGKTKEEINSPYDLMPQEEEITKSSEGQEEFSIPNSDLPF